MKILLSSMAVPRVPESLESSLASRALQPLQIGISDPTKTGNWALA